MIFLVPLVFKLDFFHMTLISNYLIKILKPNKLMFKMSLINSIRHFYQQKIKCKHFFFLKTPKVSDLYQPNLAKFM